MAAILNTQHLSRYFGGVKAVHNVSLTVDEKELRSVIGPNGAGKTTLFNVITGKMPASSGRVFYLGHDITNRSPHEIVNMGISRTFQRSSVFFGSTVFENVRIAKQAQKKCCLRFFSPREYLQEVNEETWTILDQLGLRDQALIPARNLSHGDQRLLEIGIALAGAPKILLLDEPTAGMSPRETEPTTQLIRKLANTIAVVLVEHDMDVVMSISDRISVMHQGQIIAEGTPREIQKNDLVKEAYLGKED
jgi:ABC-type branched-subunit amino acid transport system ATPase component